MKITSNILLAIVPLSLLLGSCATMQSTTSVNDDVYFMPSSAPPMASVAPMSYAPEPEQQPQTDDYYDLGTSQQLGADRSYYDMTYNDPQYYNYGRFGFNSAPMGWQTGWNGPGWGMGMGSGMGMSMGWGMGMGMGWGTGMGMGWGHGMGGMYGMYDPWNPWGYGGMGWNRPFGWNSPYGWNNGWGYNDPFYGGGYGYGNYYSPYGNCYSCYTPVVVGGSSNVIVGHRPSLGSGAQPTTTGGTTRPARNPAGLTPTQEPVKRTVPAQPNSRERYVQPNRERPVAPTQPTRRVPITPDRNRNERSQPSRSPDRNTIDRGGGNSGGGGRTSPSRDTGGGGGGGTRTSPGRR